MPDNGNVSELVVPFCRIELFTILINGRCLYPSHHLRDIMDGCCLLYTSIRYPRQVASPSLTDGHSKTESNGLAFGFSTLLPWRKPQAPPV